MELSLSNIYLVLLSVVALAILASILDAVISVSRRKTWTLDRPLLMMVHSQDRRTQSLPSVGQERREAAWKRQTQAGDLERLSA